MNFGRDALIARRSRLAAAAATATATVAAILAVVPVAAPLAHAGERPITVVGSHTAQASPAALPTRPSGAVWRRAAADVPLAELEARRKRLTAAYRFNDTVDSLLACLLGPDVNVITANLISRENSAGVFSGALNVIGFDSGIILSSGDIAGLAGPNQSDSFTTDSNRDGDPDLDALIPGYQTFDATVLEFDFECATAQEISFQYVFASEEYNEYVDSPFNDVFGFFLNGVNIATVPLGCSDAGIPVAINNLNCGNPYAGSGPNCDCYRNNDLDDGGGAINTEMDGLTQVFFATGTIQPGLNHLKIAIADAGDHILDSNVMIRCQSFVCGGPAVTGACCLPGDLCVTLAEGDCLENLGDWKGALVPCSPDPCHEPRGACCFPDRNCQIEDQNGCAQNGGIYQGDLTACDPDPCPISSDVAPIEDGPRPLEVGPVQPTPTNGPIELSWAQPTEARVRLTVWDAAGRMHGVLVDDMRPAGQFRETFDLRSDVGPSLPSGVYWIRVESGGVGVTRKVVLAN